MDTTQPAHKPAKDGHPMQYVAPTNNQTNPPQHCCAPACHADAVWHLDTGPSYEDTTDACEAHVGLLLGDSSLLNITYIGEPPVDTLEVVFEPGAGPDSMVFIEVEGHYGREAQRRPLPSVGGDGLVWTDREDGTRALRIAVPAGRLLG